LIYNEVDKFHILFKKLTNEFDSIFDFEHLTLIKLLPFILIGLYTDSHDILKKSINILNNGSIELFKINDFSIFKSNNIKNLEVDIDLILKFLEQ